MHSAIVSQISLTQEQKLIVLLKDGGKPMYQYVYREAAGVYRNTELQGFESTPLSKWNCSDWYFHIVKITKEGLGLDLKLAKDVVFENVPTEDQKIIQSANAI